MNREKGGEVDGNGACWRGFHVPSKWSPSTLEVAYGLESYCRVVWQ